MFLKSSWSPRGIRTDEQLRNAGTHSPPAYKFLVYGDAQAVNWYVYAVFIFLLIVLFSASYDALKKMYDKMRPILT
jgi:hypothetical protein